MQQFIKQLSIFAQAPHIDDYEQAGKHLVHALARDSVTFSTAYKTLHSMHHIISEAEDCLKRQALEQVSKMDTPISIERQ